MEMEHLAPLGTMFYSLMILTVSGIQSITFFSKFFSKCDVLCKNLLYGGTNSVILDQLFALICNCFMVKTTHGATKMFDVDTHERQIS